MLWLLQIFMFTLESFNTPTQSIFFLNDEIKIDRFQISASSVIKVKTRDFSLL